MILSLLFTACTNGSLESGDLEASENNEDIEILEDIGDVDQSIDDDNDVDEALLDEDGEYSDKENVALYLNTYGKLPKNFITKEEARDLGWNAKKGNLWEVAEGMSIGGDKFGNREGLLPKKDGRKYFECDINYEGGHRGAERIVFSNDGLVYYTGDHYESFTLLYGDE